MLLDGGDDAVDAGFVDGGVRDAGFAPPRDAGAGADASMPPPRDAGTAPMTPGTYSFTPSGAPPVPSAELTHVAIAPDAASMVVSERYDRLHVVALPTEALIRTVVLPRAGTESIAVNGVRYAGGRLYAVTTGYEGATTFGRVFAATPAGEMVEAGFSIPGVRFESVDLHPTVAGALQIVGQSSGGSWMRIYRLEPPSLDPIIEGQAPASAGCQDIAPVHDAFGRDVTAFACGTNSGAVGTFDGTTFTFGPSLPNTSRVASRPQRDYALFVTWSNGTLTKYEGGQFTVDPVSPVMGSTDLYDISFADDGNRALITGELIGGTAQLREYRHGSYATSGIIDISIRGFDGPPYNGTNGVVLWESAWLPGADCGYIVGGCSTPTCQRGYLIRFALAGGRACPQ